MSTSIYRREHDLKWGVAVDGRGLFFANGQPVAFSSRRAAREFRRTLRPLALHFGVLHGHVEESAILNQ